MLKSLSIKNIVLIEDSAQSLGCKINGKSLNVDVDPSTPILWVLRDHLDLLGTKYGCGISQCGACTIHINDVAVRSCQLPVSSVGDNKITTIDGSEIIPDYFGYKDLSSEGDHNHKEVPTGYYQFLCIVLSFLLSESLSNPTVRKRIAY